MTRRHESHTPPPLFWPFDIAAERSARGWTQEELGARVGVSSRTISNWEHSNRVPRSRRPALERAFARPWDETSLAAVETRQLILELLRRVDAQAVL